VHDTVGGTVSVTVTFCVAVVKLPAASVAFHVTTVVPTPNDAGASLVIVGVPATVHSDRCREIQRSRLSSPDVERHERESGLVVSTTVTC
jgi:hypothetical protein